MGYFLSEKTYFFHVGATFSELPSYKNTMTQGNFSSNLSKLSQVIFNLIFFLKRQRKAQRKRQKRKETGRNREKQRETERNREKTKRNREKTRVFISHI